MEFQSKSEKVACISILCVSVALITVLFGTLIKSSISSEQKDKAEREACKTLNVAYGDEVWTKEGFYAGEKFIAIGKSDYTVSVIFPYQNPASSMRFMCGDLQLNPPKQFQKESESER